MTEMFVGIVESVWGVLATIVGLMLIGIVVYGGSFVLYMLKEEWKHRRDD